VDVVPGPNLARTGGYSDAVVFEQQWRQLVAQLGGREAVAGRSVEGRPVWRFDLGARPGNDGARVPTVLLTALIVIDGESTWLEGSALVGLYVIIGASVWWGPPIAA